MKPALFQGIVSQSRAQLHVLPRAIPNIQTRMPDGRDVRRHDQKEERGHPRDDRTRTQDPGYQCVYVKHLEKMMKRVRRIRRHESSTWERERRQMLLCGGVGTRCYRRGRGPHKSSVWAFRGPGLLAQSGPLLPSHKESFIAIGLPSSACVVTTGVRRAERRACPYRPC